MEQMLVQMGADKVAVVEMHQPAAAGHAGGHANSHTDTPADHK